MLADIFLMALELGGHKLIRTYKKAFLEILMIVKNDFLPAYKTYTDQ